MATDDEAKAITSPINIAAMKENFLIIFLQSLGNPAEQMCLATHPLTRLPEYET